MCWWHTRPKCKKATLLVLETLLVAGVQWDKDVQGGGISRARLKGRVKELGAPKINTTLDIHAHKRRAGDNGGVSREA